MSKKDTVSREFLGDNKRFADLWNYYLYDGKEVIHPEDLTDSDTAELITIPGDKNDSLSIIGFEQTYRDLLKSCTIKESPTALLVLLGIENQSDVHYAMPVRDMLYSALNYAKQTRRIASGHAKNKDLHSGAAFLSGFTKEDRILPVITLVVYWGADVWDAPRKLSDMFAASTQTLLTKVQDYELNLIIPSEIEDFDKFKTSVKQVLEVIKASNDKKAMQELVLGNEEFRSVDKEAVYAINTFANLKIEVEEGGTVDMCKAWEDQKKEGREEGRRSVAENMLNANYSLEEISKITNLSIDEIKGIEKSLLVTN